VNDHRGDHDPAPVEVRPLRPDEHDDVTGLVGATFAADPVFTALLDDPEERLTATTALYRRVVDDAGRTVDVAVGPGAAATGGPDGDASDGGASDGGASEADVSHADAQDADASDADATDTNNASDADASDDALLGVALWSWSPGREAHKGLATIVGHATEALDLVRDVGARAAQQLGRHDALVERHRPTGPHWYLEAVAVSPAARGRGVGSRLLAARLREVDARGDVAFLEATTTASRRLYERHGFTLAAEVVSPLGVTVHAMLRPAQR